jgi:hypothetical protein
VFADGDTVIVEERMQATLAHGGHMPEWTRSWALPTRPATCGARVVGTDRLNANDVPLETCAARDRRWDRCRSASTCALLRMTSQSGFVRAGLGRIEYVARLQR